MKRIIAGLILVISGYAYGQTTNDYAVFTDGTKLYSKAGGTWTNFSRATEYVVLTWSSDDLGNKALDLFGTDYNTDATGVTITNGSPDTFTAYNDHVVFNVTNLISTGTVTVAGQRVLEDDNTTTNWTEDISVTSTGCYQTSAKFIGACTSSTANASITTDVILCSYYDFQNQDFKVSNIRMSWKPSNPTWDIGLDLFLLDNDGKTTDLLNGGFDFNNSDTPARASGGTPKVMGHAKQNIASRLILGSQDEGIIVRVTGDGDATPANITEFDLTIGIELE